MSDHSPAALARLAFNPALSATERNDALTKLYPTLRSLARRIDANAADDLVQTAFQRALEGGFDPTDHRAGIEWFKRVMSNEQVNQYRKKRPFTNAECLDGPTDNDPLVALIERESEAALKKQFNPVDVDAIINWPPRDRVLLLCRGLLWRKFPKWDDTLKELGLPAHLPGDDFEHLSSVERNARLQSALRMTASNYCRVWKDGLPRLQALEFVRGLRAS